MPRQEESRVQPNKGKQSLQIDFCKGLKTCHAKGSLHKKPRLLFSITLQNFTSEAETKGKTNQKDTDAMRGTGRMGGKEGWGLCSLLNLV